MRFLIALVLVTSGSFVLADDCPQGLCSDTETCCDGPSVGLYGCCPEPNAVCCSDGLHCCPANTVCNLKEGTCDDQNKLIPAIFRKRVFPPIEKKPVVATTLQVASKAEVVYCPGGYYFCPDSNTCCLLATGQYGCCPYPQAICCSDKVHCCPSNTHCDATSQFCLQGSSRFTALFKRPAFPMN